MISGTSKVSSCSKMSPDDVGVAGERTNCVLNDLEAPLLTARNIGRGATRYPTFIFEHCRRLPEIVAFVHSYEVVTRLLGIPRATTIMSTTTSSI